MSKPEVIRTPRSQSKTAKATAVFKEMQGQSRKEVISRFEKDIGLTPKGASTYYQTMRKNAGLVQDRSSPPTN